MADPVIVDDGGSLRLRPGVNGPIDGLLDGVADVNAAAAETRVNGPDRA